MSLAPTPARPAARTVAAVAARTLGQLVDEAARRLESAGVPGARRDARLVVGHALSLGPETVLGRPERMVSAAEAAAVLSLVARRAERRPMAQILGGREFWGLPFEVTADTLDPRPDSETVVEAALAAVPNHNESLRVLDLGTGTGCLLLSLLAELPGARGLGVDASEAALAVARRNAGALSLSSRAAFAAGDWGRGLAGAFDLIVANPPYIPARDLAALEPEVAMFEPRRALSGGADGLAAYRALAPDVARLLAPAGTAVVEFGAGQRAAVASLFAAAGLEKAAVRRDLAGRERCLVLRPAGAPAGGGE